MAYTTIYKNMFCRIELRGIDNRKHRKLMNTLHAIPSLWIDYRRGVILRVVAVGCGWCFWQGEICLGIYSKKARSIRRQAQAEAGRKSEDQTPDADVE